MLEKNKTVITRDVAIIGAGPSGLFSVFECGMLGLSAAVIDSLPHTGGQCSALYPEKPIYDVAAHPAILAGDLIEKLEMQAAPFKPEYILSQEVTALEGVSGAFKLKTSQNREIACKAIIIAGGAGCFGPNRPPLTDIEKFENRSIFYSVKRKQDFTGKKIIIAGGGDSAVDWALALVGIGSEIHLVHRRDKFKAAPASLEKLQQLVAAQKIHLHIPFQLHGLNGSEGLLESFDIIDLEGNIKTLKADILLPFFGLSAELGALKEWGLNLHKNTIEINPQTAATSLKGIYAVGDIAYYQHKLKLITVGFAEACIAAHSLYREIFPDKILHFEYSTTKGLPNL